MYGYVNRDVEHLFMKSTIKAIEAHTGADASTGFRGVIFTPGIQGMLMTTFNLLLDNWHKGLITQPPASSLIGAWTNVFYIKATQTS